MDGPSQGLRLRIYTGEAHHWHGKSLHLALLEQAKKQGLSGGTVLRGIAGFGAHEQIHTARLVDIAPDLPMIVEFVDEEAKIRAFLPTVEELVQQGAATLEPVDVILYRKAKQ